MITTGNSSPLALCSVISQMRASRVPCSSSTSDSSDRRSTKPPSDGSGSRLSYSRAADTSSAGSRSGSRRPRCAPRAGPAGSRSGRASCRCAIDTDSCRAISVSADDQIAERRQRRRCARGAAAARRAPRTSRAQSELADGAGCEPGEQQRQIVVVGRQLELLERVHHALADAARRHVDHAPQADVVVRVDDQLQVGERVLDFLALVEPDAADDLVGEALAHQRVFDRARLRVGAVEHGDRRVDVVGERRRAPCA